MSIPQNPTIIPMVGTPWRETASHGGLTGDKGFNLVFPSKC